MKELKRAHIFVSGIVQGVFFRANTKEKAEELGLLGWVRNLADGQVEAVFEGQEEKIKEMINWLKSHPGSSKVEKIKIIWEEPTFEFSGFKIQY